MLLKVWHLRQLQMLHYIHCQIQLRIVGFQKVLALVDLGLFGLGRLVLLFCRVLETFGVAGAAHVLLRFGILLLDKLDFPFHFEYIPKFKL